MEDLNNLSKEEKIEYLQLLEEKERRYKQNMLSRMFPDYGINDKGLEISRHLYPKHIEFFKAGAKYKERAFIAANRSGKTQSALTEITYHLTGLYPHWWAGKRFDTGINAMCFGKTNLTARNIIQHKFLGSLLKSEYGTGLIPGHLLVSTRLRPGVPDAIQDVYIKHASGDTSHLMIASYEQGRSVLEGTEQHIIHFDEEPEHNALELYSEGLIRTMTTKGIIIVTFTPLDGISDIVLSFLPNIMAPDDGIVSDSKFVVQASWDDAPHLSKDEQKEILDSCLPFQRDARSKGLPAIGTGKIYPVAEDDVFIEPFLIPPHWPKAYGLDPGWNRTACVWMTQNPTTGIMYIYDEYYRGQAEPPSHTSAIQSRGKWINGAMDYSGLNSGNGQRLLHQYQDQGLNVCAADKGPGSVEAGILAIYRALCDGRLKIFTNCQNVLKEFRIYRYDKNGKPHKEHDHLMDAMRYIFMLFEGVASIEEDPDDEEKFYTPSRLGSDSVTGY